MVRGTRSGRVRCMDFEIDLPELPGNSSFFEQQEAATA